VRAWYAAAGEGVAGAEVRLCVATRAAAASGAAAAAAVPVAAGDEAHAERVTAWCLDEGFEHVPLPDACGGAAAAHEGAGAVEAQGVARVREALHAHTWPGLTAKPRPARVPAAAAAAPPAVPPLGADDDTLTAASAAAAAAAAPGEGEENADDEFDALMGAMLQARDAASAGALGDGERRAAAAALALRMAALLGGDSDDESDDSEA
jgi:hypothetical protein